MKKIILLLFLIIPFVSFSQDGIYSIIKSWRKSNIVSVFNSTHGERYFIGDYLCEKIVKKDKSSGFKDLTPYVASAIISSKTKNEKILDICKDYLECRAFHVIQEKQQ